MMNIGLKTGEKNGRAVNKEKQKERKPKTFVGQNIKHLWKLVSEKLLKM